MGIEASTAARGGSSPPAVELKGISKRFVLRRSKPFLLRDFLHRLTRRSSPDEEFWALREVSIAIRRGEAVGLVGGNGAGKSTLLGILCGAVVPTTGTAVVNGRVGALLELGAGFHPDLTGRENIFLNASLLGMTEELTRERLDDIVGFAELEEFIDVQVRNYSSGMYVRLGFSVAIHTEPDLLIIDEALAVGDLKFQQKCLDRILGMKRRGATLLIASHALDQLRALCERVVWLEHGRVRADGPAAQVLGTYAAGVR